MKNFKILLVLLFSITYVFAIAQVDFITPKEFMKIKNDKNLVLIDAGKSKNYDVNHIKDAINIPHKEMYKEGEIEGLLMADADLAKFFGDKGVSENNMMVDHRNILQEFIGY